MVKTIRAFLLRIILENAIVFEEKAYRFYEAAEQMVNREEVKQLLTQFKAEELKHRLRIEEAQRQADINVCCATDAEFKAAMDGMREDWPAVEVYSNRSDILKVAYGKEVQARDYYLKMRDKFPNSFVKSVFEALAKEEERHARLIAEKME
ncbi:MAG: ferritin family protein [Spirochaetia bacterium]